MGIFRRSGQLRWVAGVVSAMVLLTACTSTAHPDVTVTHQVTVAGSANPGATSTGQRDIPPSVSRAPGSPASPGATTDAGTTGSSTAASTSASSDDAGSGPAYGTPPGVVVKTEPDGFKITKLKPGQKAPQFIVYSFDGVGWDEKWQYWFGITQKVPLHFTGFLSGVYLLTNQTKLKYTGPGHKPGKSSIPFGTAADLPVEIGNLNKALGQGEEIGTHFVGHFCDDNAPGGTQWDTGNWNDELDQFFSFLKNVDVNNGITAKLNLTAADIKGERTPCLTGHSADLFPALEAHNMTYDSSFQEDGNGLAWPTKSADGKIWQMGMAEFPIHGTGHPQITMDYNFYAQQEPNSIGSGNPPSPAQSQADSAQVLATYQDMLKAAITDGVNEPLILGNHFENWNNNAYTQALATFALHNCGKPGIYCVPFRDVVDWMDAQDPNVMAALQNHRSNLGGCPYDKWPHCDGLIRY
jgi:hypothetical protein